MPAASSTSATLDVAGRAVPVTNLQKVLYPAVGFTKADVIDYFVRISPVLLPHLRDRALTLKRYPGGVTGEFFYEKKCPSHRPPWVKTLPVYSERNDADINYCVANDLPTLVWLANLADLELHTSLALARQPMRPTCIAFDLDPGPPATIVECCEVGLLVRAALQKLGLDSYAKTSGSKGLQIYAPLNTPGVTFEQTKVFAHELAQLIEKARPDLVVSRMLKSLRGGKVLIDWSQNDDHKTTVCAYSLRAKDRPTVSTPITWEEVDECLAAKDPERLVFDSEAVLKRVEDHGDLFAPVVERKQKLPKARR